MIDQKHAMPSDEQTNAALQRALKAAFVALGDFNVADDNFKDIEGTKAVLAAFSASRTVISTATKKFRSTLAADTYGHSIYCDHLAIVANAIYAKSSDWDPEDMHPYAVAGYRFCHFARAVAALSAVGTFDEYMEWDECFADNNLSVAFALLSAYAPTREKTNDKGKGEPA